MIYRDQLEAVYALLEDPSRWTKEHFARNVNDDPIDDDYDANDDGESLSDEEQATHRDACKWCLYGAAYKCGIVSDMDYASALGVRNVHGVYDVALFNDSHTHAEVLALLRSAIDRAPAREDAL